MKATTLLITPPFTQLNTPYPATAYLKGFLNTKNISSYQCDVGIEVILSVFSKNGLTKLFQLIETNQPPKSENATRIIALQQEYINTIDAVILFLQGKNATLSNLICQDNFLPTASRFNQTDDLDWAFGNMGNQDKAKHLATLYLEDLSDLIIECVDEHFGFSRYAERLGRSANSFDELYTYLQKEYTFFDKLLIEILSEKIKTIQPKLVAISIPFPGNLYSAFRCAQWIKKNHPTIKIAFGGGFPNTELRSISDTRVFEFIDFITLDDGELPIELLINNIEVENPTEFKRTFLLENNRVIYKNNSLKNDYKQNEVGTPDYADLLLDKYISVIEIANPMHKMWSDGRWNKLTMAHGCYWAKCTFCDISLDYIKVYEPIAAKLMCDRMETIITQTGESGFHFVDEAAPPALMRALAIEIIKRKLVVSWWTNIRFEKSFTKDLCVLLKASGCIAVSGGLEVASDRLLALIDKGVTVEQVAKVNRNFTEAGIMVHSYLMYGYPTQTIQETIDSLEMVRQLFELGILQSGFWHQFAMTAHSPIGLHPEKFGVKKQTETIGTFANNDIFFFDETGIDHDQFSFGLKKSLLNYMHGIGFELPLQSWFDFKIPKTKIAPHYITTILNKEEINTYQPTTKIIWLGSLPIVDFYTKTKKANSYEMAKLTFHTKAATHEISISKTHAIWLLEILALISVNNNKIYTLQEIKQHYEQHNLEDFELFWFNKPMNTLPEFGLIKF
ncbi:MAG: radical SAM protein [Saprospirales bacterium]|nr:radical SAM protein [Saprospirales bacterium]